MSWIKTALHELAANRPIQVRVIGGSMRPRIDDGEVVTISPVNTSEIEVDDIVLVRIRRNQFLIHRVVEIDHGRYLIGNNLGKTDGWVTSDAIHGKVVRIGEDTDFAGITVKESAPSTSS